MAGPHVAGVVALMISANPDLAGQVEAIETIIEENIVYEVANHGSKCPVELLYDIELWEMVMGKLVQIFDENLSVSNQKVA